jgi:hypothetical protein
MEPNKIIIAGWVDQALKQSFTKNKIGLGLKIQECGL